MSGEARAAVSAHTAESEATEPTSESTTGLSPRGKVAPQEVREVGGSAPAKRMDLRDVDIYYGSFKAVAGVTLPIEPRAVTAFIGPSGCGKSTVLRTLNRMHEVIRAPTWTARSRSTGRTSTPRTSIR